MRNLLSNLHSLSFEIFSSFRAKFLTVGCVSKRPRPIVFVVCSAQPICFSGLDLKNPVASLNDTDSRLRLKNTDTEFLLRLKTAIRNMSYV